MKNEPKVYTMNFTVTSTVAVRVLARTEDEAVNVAENIVSESAIDLEWNGNSIFVSPYYSDGINFECVDCVEYAGFVSESYSDEYLSDSEIYWEELDDEDEEEE